MKSNILVLYSGSKYNSAQFPDYQAVDVDTITKIDLSIDIVVSIESASDKVLKLAEHSQLKKIVFIYPNPLNYSNALSRGITLEIVAGIRRRNYSAVVNSSRNFSNIVNIYRELTDEADYSPIEIFEELQETNNLVGFKQFLDFYNKITVRNKSNEQLELYKLALSNMEKLVSCNSDITFVD